MIRLRNILRTYCLVSISKSKSPVLYGVYLLWIWLTGISNQASANNSLRFETIILERNMWETSEYFQTPSHELDARWAELFTSTQPLLSILKLSPRILIVIAVRGTAITSKEASQLNLSSLPLNNGRQAVVLGIYHNLHCLVSLSVCNRWYLSTSCSQRSKTNSSCTFYKRVENSLPNSPLWLLPSKRNRRWKNGFRNPRA